MKKYHLFVPKQAVGANLVYFDLFNNSADNIELDHVIPVVSGAVAVTGVLGVDLFLTYTSAVGTGGTAATRDGTDITAATFTKLNNKGDPMRSEITARLTPTGGATAGGIISMVSVFTEETGGGTYSGQLSDLLADDKVIIAPGFGIRVIQGAVASVGNIAFIVGIQL